MPRQVLRPPWIAAAAATLLLVLAAELFFSIRHQSQTFDESAHLYAGYSYWKHRDFAINPEHPPLAKLVAALPLLPTHLDVQPAPPIYFRGASAVGGIRFLYSHDADALLFRSRAATSVFTFLLAAVLFIAGLEMFGPGAALLALLLLVFEPNILAHGALITTDMGLAALLFASVYTFYRYVRRPSLLRLLLCGLTVGLTLAVKHSGLLILPLLAVLAAAELALPPNPAPAAIPAQPPRETRARHALRLADALLLIAVMAYTILWAFYGFRYDASPYGKQNTPSTAAFLDDLHRPAEARTIAFAERHHLLPEAYLYGLTDIAILTDQGRPTFLFGTLFPSGRWFYFPSALLIKSTLAFLALLALTLAARPLWDHARRRELVFLVLPPLLFLAVAMRSRLDIGLRHILPIYPFLLLLAGAAAWFLSRQSRRWTYAIALLLALHIASSLHAAPTWLPYSNELFGGPSRTYRVLADSNVGWSTGLPALHNYIAAHGIAHCWFAFDGITPVAHYGIPCEPLPTLFSFISGTPQPVVPQHIQGPIFFNSLALTGFDWGPPSLNPYRSFSALHPDAVIQGEMLLFNGAYDVPRVTALSLFLRASQDLRAGHPDQALAEAQQSAALAPDFLATHEILSSLYAGQHQLAAARQEYAIAEHLYRTTYADFPGGVPPPQDPTATTATTH